MELVINVDEDWADSHAPEINHQAVVKDIIAEVEITPGYFLALNVANLIALCGLLLGSSPVIIGAMLISPLMGPILSFGFAFVTGDETIWHKGHPQNPPQHCPVDPGGHPGHAHYPP